MKTQPLLIVLTVVNLGILIFTLAQLHSAVAATEVRSTRTYPCHTP